nr:GNAT family N-acetyltransferase [Anaerobacillus isosaccharinicus]QOY38701.1 GNAT family N-acetyltransferase [Anaerobacillus isosaccharinicus]
MLMGSLHGDHVRLAFAQENEKKIIYDMLVSPEVINLMFDEKHSAPTWDEFNEEEPDDYFSGNPNKHGNYMLINVKEETIGTIVYSIGTGKLNCAELDIWISSKANLGKGYGSEALNLLMNFIKSHYKIKTFIIRPWVKNINAIKAYKKCGFKEIEAFNPADYYSEEKIEDYGEGDYGVNETVNLIYKLE